VSDSFALPLAAALISSITACEAKGKYKEQRKKIGYLNFVI
jgi:hypothetical protein